MLALNVTNELGMKEAKFSELLNSFKDISKII